MIILLVEDDTALAMGTTYALESEGMQVIHTTDCAQTRKVCGTDQKIDLVLLDVMLPDGDGFSLCEWLKGEQPDIPVIFLTALEDEGNVVHGLQYADDYITKPFVPVEVLARIRSQLRRYSRMDTRTEDKETLTIGGISLDDRTKSVTVEGEPVSLTPTEYSILHLLMSNPGKVYSTKALYEAVWREAALGSEGSVAVHIRHLREKIEINPKEPRYLKVVWGVGYKIEKN